jgi:anti-anti-sigma factor
MGARRRPGPADRFAVVVDHGDERTIVAVHGELDLANAPRLEAAIADERVRSAERLVIDLSAIGFIDSTGLRVILATSEEARASGQRFAVTRGGEQVQRIFAVTGADRRLEVLGSLDEA